MNQDRAKELFNQLAANEEFQDVVIVGVRKNQTIGWYATEQNFGFLAACTMILQKRVLDNLVQQPNPQVNVTHN